MVLKGVELIVCLYSFLLFVVVVVEGYSIVMGVIMFMVVDLCIGKDVDIKYGFNEIVIGMVLLFFGMELVKVRLVNMF